LKNPGEEHEFEERRAELGAGAFRRRLLGGGAGGIEPASKVWVNAPRVQNPFTHYRGIILEHSLLVAAVFLLCVGIAVAVAVLEPAGYRAKLSIELLGINENFLNLQQVDPTAPSPSNSSGDSYAQTQMELLKRDALVERVVRRLHLDQNDSFSARRGVLGWLHWPVPNPAATDRVQLAVRTAQRKLKVQQLRQSNLIEVSFEDPDPKVAVDFVNTITQEAVDENMRSRWGLSQNVGAWLGQHLTDLRAKMEAAEHELEAYSAGAGIMTTDAGSSVEDTRLQRLQEQLARAQTNRIEKESRYTIARSADLDSLPEVLDDPALKEYRVRLADLRRQKAELSTALTPDHPKVQRVQAQITELQATIAHERTNILNRLRNEYAADRAQEDAVAAAAAAEASKVSEITQKEIHYNTLKHELETTRSMYEDVLKRVNDAQLASVPRTSGMRIVDPATVPERQDILGRRIFLGGIGAFAGLLLAGVLVFVLEQTNNTVKAPGYTPALLNVPELGIIPPIRKPNLGRFKIVSGPLTAAGGEGALAGSSSASSKSVSVLTVRLRSSMDPKELSSISDSSFQSVINSILFALDEGKDQRLIAVSSPGPGEGKTTITANLGLMLSEIGHRVLLIDADLRRPSLHRVFGIENEAGLTDILADSAPISSERIKTSVQRASTGHLDVLTAGIPAIRPFSLLHSKRTSELIGTVRKDYDLILIDTPPLLLVPESRILGRVTDWSILVFRAGKTTVDAALGAQRRMAEDGIPLLGTILNDCHPRHASYGYSGYYARRANG